MVIESWHTNFGRIYLLFASRRKQLLLTFFFLNKFFLPSGRVPFNDILDFSTNLTLKFAGEKVYPWYVIYNLPVYLLFRAYFC